MKIKIPFFTKKSKKQKISENSIEKLIELEESVYK